MSLFLFKGAKRSESTNTAPITTAKGCGCGGVQGRCKQCNTVIAHGWRKCPNCGWEFQEGELNPVCNR